MNHRMLQPQPSRTWRPFVAYTTIKLLAIMAACVLLFCLAGCGGGDADDAPADDTTQSIPAQPSRQRSL